MIGRVEAVATPPSRSEAWSSHDLFRAVSKALAALDPFRLAGAVLFIAVWEVASLLVSPIILPGPLSVLRRAATDFWSAPALSYYGVEDPSLAGNLAYTAENVAIAALIGAVVGVTLGLLSARIWFVRAAMDPVMMTAGTVPILIAAPFLLIWFGVGRASAVSLVAFYIVVILYLSAQRAALNLDPIYENYALTLALASWANAARHPDPGNNSGNPWRFPHRARWLLGARGRCGTARLTVRDRQGARSPCGSDRPARDSGHADRAWARRYCHRWFGGHVDRAVRGMAFCGLLRRRTRCRLNPVAE